ncbi:MULTISPECIES: hypothetical protein [Thermoleptolyngbya]|nr:MULTISPECIES: hypothetical protein [Thermoleptolyngbya]
MAIDRLHLLRYAERFEWTRALDLPPYGIILDGRPGEVLRYLHREIRSNPSANE